MTKKIILTKKAKPTLVLTRKPAPKTQKVNLRSLA